MDAEMSSRLRELRAHQRAQITDKWREREIREFEKQKRSIQQREDVSQMTGRREDEVGPKGMDGSAKEVRQFHMNPS